jgi:transcriptional regulator of acetoin/glycerol metabolism
MPNTTQIMRNGRRLLATRDELLTWQDTTSPGLAPLRAEIAASWRRSRAHGVRPDRFTVPRTPPGLEAAASADLLRLAAAPVADAVGTDLAGTGVSLLVSDQEARIVDRRVPDAGQRAKLDRLGLAPGFDFGEEAVGTTAISVALSHRGPALVAAGEHYADTLTTLVCAAAPVIDRRTRRVIGTIGLACRAEAASPLMVALVNRAARDVELLLAADGPWPPAQTALVDQAAQAEQAALAEQAELAEQAAGSAWDSLTATELSVAEIIAQGATNREAAARMFLSRHTIDFHLRQIFRKLGVASRVELTRLVITRRNYVNT